jgi:hypothetical protein
MLVAATGLQTHRHHEVLHHQDLEAFQTVRLLQLLLLLHLIKTLGRRQSLGVSLPDQARLVPGVPGVPV